jgi:hypothetical protein
MAAAAAAAAADRLVRLTPVAWRCCVAAAVRKLMWVLEDIQKMILAEAIAWLLLT